MNTKSQSTAYSRLSLSKNRVTVVISIPSANVSTTDILDAFYEQTDHVSEFIQTHDITSL